ncbi:MAG: 50S ribosomal protein L10 [Pseudomonadota bacterium]
MSLNIDSKQQIVAELSQQLSQAQAVVLAEYRGVTVSAMTQLRAKAREAGVYFRVVRNTLVRRAVQNTPFEALADQMSGPLIYGISQDPVAAAKIVHEFAKTNDKLIIKAGAMPGQVMDAKAIGALAQLPSREVLLAQVLGTLQAPIAQFVRTLNEVPTGFVRVLAALKDIREEK